MSELSTPGSGNVAGVSASGLLLSCSALLLSSLASYSHPLFSHLVKLVAFLGPLFVTTFLVLLALFTLLSGFVQGGTLGTRFGSVLEVCSTVLINKFKSNADEGTQQQSDAFEGLEVYRIIFEASDQESGRYGTGSEESEPPPVDKFLIYGDQDVRMPEVSLPSETDGNCLDEEIARPEIESGKKLGALFQEKPCCETDSLEGMEVKAKVKAEGEDFKKDDDEEKQEFHNSKSDSLCIKESEAKINDGGDDSIVRNKNNGNVLVRRRQGSRRFDEGSLRVYENGDDREIVDGNLGGFGSMRREKEWKRTLACKLMEERRDVEGEGMDSLWETYNEDESSWSSNKDTANKAKKEKKGRRKEEEDGEEEEGMMEERFCCLQALRLSAGKMGGLGIGKRPNLVRISKAFTGIGWLHHHHVLGHGNKKHHTMKGRN